MKNKITIFAVLLVAATMSAMADVEALYWQVTAVNNPDPISFTAAAFAATDGSQTVYLRDEAGHAWQAANTDKATTEVVASLWDTAYASEAWSFFIELKNQVDGNWITVGTINKADGSNFTYTDIQPNIASSMSMSLVTPLASAGRAHIPEPTSGLLMLVGGALLALRRRRV